MIPHAGTDDLLTELDEPGARSIVWVPGPAEGRMLHFTLLLADESVRPTSPLPISDGDIKVGRLDMPRGKSVWIFARDLPMAREQSDWAAAFAADMKITYSRRRPRTSTAPYSGSALTRRDDP